MQQSDKISILETVAFVRGSAHIICKFAQSKLDVFFSRAILAAENKPSFFFIKSCLISPPSLADMHTLYSKTRAPLHILPVRFRRIPPRTAVVLCNSDVLAGGAYQNSPSIRTRMSVVPHKSDVFCLSKKLDAQQNTRMYFVGQDKDVNSWT